MRDFLMRQFLNAPEKPYCTARMSVSRGVGMIIPSTKGVGGYPLRRRARISKGVGGYRCGNQQRSVPAPYCRVRNSYM